jgi:hypothetical protein
MAKGHGERLSRKREATIAALIQYPTVGAAARAVGINPKTVTRWMADPEFIEAYRAARLKLVELAVGSMQSAAPEAVGVLRRKLRVKREGVQMKAAAYVYDRAVRAVELASVLQRVEQLEATLARVTGSETPVGVNGHAPVR